MGQASDESSPSSTTLLNTLISTLLYAFRISPSLSEAYMISSHDRILIRSLWVQNHSFYSKHTDFYWNGML